MTLRFDRSDGGLAGCTAAALKGGVGASDFDGGVKSVCFEDDICAGDVEASADDFESGTLAVGGEDGAAGFEGGDGAAVFEVAGASFEGCVGDNGFEVDAEVFGAGMVPLGCVG